MYYLFFTCVEEQFRFLFLRGLGSWEGRGRIGHKPISPNSKTFAHVLNKIEALRSYVSYSFLLLNTIKVLRLRALSICQNWPAEPWPD